MNISGMVRNRRLARAVADTSMAGFVTKMEYKCRWYGTQFVKVDRWYPSLKLCAHCGWKNEYLKFSERE